ncbi:MAG: AbrB/MazE/SpoVT family DNA-binding domain-containing protein [Thermoproteota archaeon]
MVIKNVDRQGRLVIPKKWREEVLGDRKVVLVRKGEVIEIRAYSEADLTNYFDSMPVDLDSDLSDWHSVRRELKSGEGL